MSFGQRKNSLCELICKGANLLFPQGKNFRKRIVEILVFQGHKFFKIKHESA